MIPNIFLSSTIRDLHYLREAIRECIIDLAYNPVMSDFGEIGYLNPTTAATSCYRSIEQCQMFILIVGKRYGNPSDNGLSVTHRELLSAQEHAIPTITFVEPQVLTYRELFESSQDNSMWDSFPHMDHPKRTFQLIDDVGKSSSYNAILPFNDVTDAKRKLKLQIADFVGTNLENAALTYRPDFREFLAELKTLRNQLNHLGPVGAASKNESKRYLQTMRFLLEEKNADYRSLLTNLAGDIDAALPIAMKAKSFEDLIKRCGYSIERHPDEDFQGFMHANWKSINPTGYSYSVNGGHAITPDKRLLITANREYRFDMAQKALKAKLDSAV